jgi:hypothetical protein
LFIIFRKNREKTCPLYTLTFTQARCTEARVRQWLISKMERKSCDEPMKWAKEEKHENQ